MPRRGRIVLSTGLFYNYLSVSLQWRFARSLIRQLLLRRRGEVMSLFRRTLTQLLFIIVLTELAWAGTEVKIRLAEVKAALSDIQISKGPDSSKLTRSPWGPDLYRAKVNAVVLVAPFKLDPGGEIMILGQGSGVVVSRSGDIVTNWHVTWPHDYVVIVFYPGPNIPYDEITDNHVWIAEVLNVAQSKDLAVVRLVINTAGIRTLPADLNVVPLEDPGYVQVGQDVFTIGHPEGLHWTYTEGVISQIRPRYRWASDGDSFRATVIQTQTTVSYGSSGGPLINQKGKLVGIISQMVGRRAGLNFAISVHELKTFLGK